MNDIKVGCRKASPRTKAKIFPLTRDYRCQYSDDEMARLGALGNGEAYVLFNNISMYGGALRFKQLIQSGR